MNTIEIDDWLTHLQDEVDAVGDQLHRLVTTLMVVGLLLAAAVAGVALALYLY